MIPVPRPVTTDLPGGSYWTPDAHWVRSAERTEGASVSRRTRAVGFRTNLLGRMRR